ncbi:MAG: alpha/beta fold hydrolase [Succinivibrio sp.]
MNSKSARKFAAMAAAVAFFAAPAASHAASNPINVADFGVFSSGGTVTAPAAGKYNPQKNWLDSTRAGTTAHVDHASVLYAIPEPSNSIPVVMLHGYGQSRTGFMTTPDGRQGWAQDFMRKGYPVFLVDQPRRGEAGAAVSMTSDPLDAKDGGKSKDYMPGDQAWYTHFRIGRVAPQTYDGSQFPKGDRAQDQFFRQMTPNTGSFDVKVNADALAHVLADSRRMAGGRKAVFIAHSQGCTVAVNTSMKDAAALVLIEPGRAPAAGSEQFKNLLDAKIPVIFYYGDYIANGPKDIESTKFWQESLASARAFAKAFNEKGGDAQVVSLPDEGIHGNSHFMFEEMNSTQIAESLISRLKAKGL